MQKDHPAVALSVKTRHATYAVLDHCHAAIEQMMDGGILEENDAKVLLIVSFFRAL